MLFVLLAPIPRCVLSRQQAQWGCDGGIIWYESRYILCHTKQRLHFTMALTRSCLVDGFNFPWIRFQTTRAENVTIALDFGLGELTLVFV